MAKPSIKMVGLVEKKHMLLELLAIG